MTTALLARKLGMAQVFGDDGRCFGVTVLEAGPCPVVQVKTAAADGYDAVQIGFGPLRRRSVNRAQAGHF